MQEGTVATSFSLELPNNTVGDACAFTEYLKNITSHQMDLQGDTNTTKILNFIVTQLTHEFGTVPCTYTPYMKLKNLNHVFDQKQYGFQVLSCLGEWIERFMNISRSSASCVLAFGRPLSFQTRQ